MADPVNYLDRFASYTYHFELHASPNWDTLKAAGESDSNLATTRKEPNGTLLINTRKDAHQHIDNVRFTTIANFADPFANLSADGELFLDVDEPGSMCFAEKIASLQTRYKAKSLTSDFHFGLKIMFVGRYPDNTIETKPLSGIIPLQLLECEGSFTHQGAKYHMQFLVASYLLSKNPRHPNNKAPQALIQMNRNMTLSSLTCQDALKQLEDKLNDHYKINVNQQIKGELKIANTNNYAKGSPSNVSFAANTDVNTMIRKILYGTEDVAKMIAESKDGVKKAFHPGVKYPLITPNMILRDGVCEVNIDVDVYEGSNYKKFIFDYYFSDPGKNVDVLSMDIKFPSLTTWMNMRTAHSTALYSNNTADLANKKPKVYTEDVIYPDVMSRKLKEHIVEKVKVDLPQNAVLIPGSTSNDKFDMVNYKYEFVPQARMAFASLTAAHGSTEEQVNCVIRGHLELLEDCNMYPDGGKKAFGTTRGIWVKINVFQVVDDVKEPFYYTGWYQLMAVENVFSNGKFTQNLALLMKEDQK